MSKTDPIKKPADIKRLKNFFLQGKKYRDYAMVTLVLNTSIKMETMLRLRWRDILDSTEGCIRRELNLSKEAEKLMTQDIKADARKGGSQHEDKDSVCGNGQKDRILSIYLNEEVRKAFEIYMDSLGQVIPGDYVFKSRVGSNQPLGRIAVHRLIKKAAAELGIEGNISLQSLKKTLGYQAWEQGYSKDVIMDLYHHPSVGYTRRFLSIPDKETEDTEKRKLMEKIRL